MSRTSRYVICPYKFSARSELSILLLLFTYFKGAFQTSAVYVRKCINKMLLDLCTDNPIECNKVFSSVAHRVSNYSGDNHSQSAPRAHGHLFNVLISD